MEGSLGPQIRSLVLPSTLLGDHVLLGNKDVEATSAPRGGLLSKQIVKQRPKPSTGALYISKIWTKF